MSAALPIDASQPCKFLCELQKGLLSTQCSQAIEIAQQMITLGVTQVQYSRTMDPADPKRFQAQGQGEGLIITAIRILQTLGVETYRGASLQLLHRQLDAVGLSHDEVIQGNSVNKPDLTANKILELFGVKEQSVAAPMPSPPPGPVAAATPMNAAPAPSPAPTSSH